MFPRPSFDLIAWYLDYPEASFMWCVLNHFPESQQIGVEIMTRGKRETREKRRKAGKGVGVRFTGQQTFLWLVCLQSHRLSAAAGWVLLPKGSWVKAMGSSPHFLCKHALVQGSKQMSALQQWWPPCLHWCCLFLTGFTDVSAHPGPVFIHLSNGE